MELDLQAVNSAVTRAAAGAAEAIADAASLPVCDDALPLGAHLVSDRNGYSHHGIYVGDGRVVHYAGLCASLHRGPIEEVTLERFAAGHSVRIVPHPYAAYAGRTAVLRARSRLGENRYRLLTNNCEHFCTWCVEGTGHSEQVRTCVMHPRTALRFAIRFALSACRAVMATRLSGGRCAAAGIATA
ncbi:lecithin retinol acyltransferase family protein [Burkholderia sp. Ac-20353]|uniref:lecithin retinol acyltransferase family protein n=1 Tax=Burkholderia sp. Ac-20353 TaxID=2703894 RepID=UPI00197C004D|nr:lecithin retinol acyltransferase family protein [Burkholderia sp. Ac-20353]MBN3788842.1 lecithin retinol acyltransferase family protein [Burkholderia sp. Ac-20353]